MSLLYTGTFLNIEIAPYIYTNSCIKLSSLMPVTQSYTNHRLILAFALALQSLPSLNPSLRRTYDPAHTN